MSCIDRIEIGVNGKFNVLMKYDESILDIYRFELILSSLINENKGRLVAIPTQEALKSKKQNKKLYMFTEYFNLNEFDSKELDYIAMKLIIKIYKQEIENDE